VRQMRLPNNLVPNIEPLPPFDQIRRMQLWLLRLWPRPLGCVEVRSIEIVFDYQLAASAYRLQRSVPHEFRTLASNAALMDRSLRNRSPPRPWAEPLSGGHRRWGHLGLVGLYRRAYGKAA
jgi:hypothetical protein